MRLHEKGENSLTITTLCESPWLCVFYTSMANSTITAIRCTTALPLLFSLLCNELRKPVSKTRKTLELGRPVFFLSPTTSGSWATRGRRKILNPPRSLGIWREPVRKQRRGVDYDDRGNNARGAVRIPRDGRAVSGCIAHPSVTHNRGSFLAILPQLYADRQDKLVHPHSDRG